VQMARDYDRMVRILKQCLPSVVSIGTLIKAGEINMNLDTERLVKAAKAVGIQVVVVSVASNAEILEASQTLMRRGIGAVCQVPSNFMGTSFESLSKVARAARIPIFSFQTDQAVAGAAVTLAPEGLECGKDTARVMLRIMRGEAPGNIPFQNFTKDEFFINPKAVSATGMVIPPELLKQAAVIVEP
jgi:putative ABC transport system substrate-binding protein